MFIKEIARDLTVFTLSNVNDAISFKPQLCFEVPRQDYQALKENYINFTGTSIRKNRSRLYFLPTNVSDELQKLNPSIPEDAKIVPNDGKVYYKNRLISELDYENVKRVEIACAYIAYTALNTFVHFETEVVQAKSSYSAANKSGNQIAHNLLNSSNIKSQGGKGHATKSNNYNDSSSSNSNSNSNDYDEDDDGSPSESLMKALRKGNILGFRELGHLVGITPWHFHRVFKVITGLTIREYGQLCVEFIKKNQEIIDTCKVRVEQMKTKQQFSCLDDADFLKDGSIQYAPTEDVVLLHEYFIDPNKSKEFKTRKSSNSNSHPNNTQTDTTTNSNDSNIKNSNDFNSKPTSTATNDNRSNSNPVPSIVGNSNSNPTTNYSYNSNYGFNSNPTNIRYANTNSYGVSTTMGQESFPKKTFKSSEHLSNLNDEVSSTSQRSEIRKRRSSVMHGRMQRAAQNSVTSNSLLYECLTSPPGDLNLSEYCNDMENNELDNGNETDTSGASSVWENQNNMFPPAQATRSASPSTASRKNSIISFTSGGIPSGIPSEIVQKSQTNHKISKRKSVSSGNNNNHEALQQNMLHRRNKSDVESIGLNMEPLQAELSLDSRLSLSPREYPIEFNSNVFNNLQSPTTASTTSKSKHDSIRDTGDNGFFNGDITNGLDFTVNDSSIDYNMMSMSNVTPMANNDGTNIMNPTSMADISLFDNSLMDQTPVSNSNNNADSGISSMLGSSGLALRSKNQGGNGVKFENQDIQLDALLNDANILYDGNSLTPSATSILSSMDNGKLMADLGSMVPKSANNGSARNSSKNLASLSGVPSNNSKVSHNNFKMTPAGLDSADPPIRLTDHQSGPDYFFNPGNCIDDEAGLLFDSNGLLTGSDGLVLPRDATNLHTTTTAHAGNSNDQSLYDF